MKQLFWKRWGEAKVSETLQLQSLALYGGGRGFVKCYCVEVESHPYEEMLAGAVGAPAIGGASAG